MIMVEEWVVSFTPRRPGETVGPCIVSRGGFSYSGSLNYGIQETVDAFWEEAKRAETAFLAAQPLNEAAEAAIKGAA